MEIYKRIREFQEDMENVEILKSTEAYGYYYANLDNILTVIHPILKKHKIWYTHKTSYEVSVKCNVLETVVYCVDDVQDNFRSCTLIDNEATLAKMNRFMTEGSAITYFRRYHLTTMLGLVTDEDTDAGGKRVKSGGRSVESRGAEKSVDFVDIFTKQAATKTHAQITKTFDAYKSQMSNDDIKAVEKIIKDKYEN